MRCLDVTEKTNDSECLVFLGGKPKKNTSQMYNSKNMFVYKLTKLILLLMFFFQKNICFKCVCAPLFFYVFSQQNPVPLWESHLGWELMGRFRLESFGTKKKRMGNFSSIAHRIHGTVIFTYMNG